MFVSCACTIGANLNLHSRIEATVEDEANSSQLKVSNGIAWLDDVQQFYRDRSAIEREYSQKLGGLARKYFEKKTKKQSSLSVGDNPVVTPGSLERYARNKNPGESESL